MPTRRVVSVIGTSIALLVLAAACSGCRETEEPRDPDASSPGERIGQVVDDGKDALRSVTEEINKAVY